MSDYSFFNLDPYKNTIYKDFYDQLFDELKTPYMALGFPEYCGTVYTKAIYMPWDFIDILNTRSMKASLGKIQTAHSYKLNDRMCDTRFEHMCFTYMLGVDLLIILSKNSYQVDAKTKVAFLLKLLLHDNGHGPFSHPFEEMVDGYKGMHEDIGKRNITEDAELFRCLEKIYPGLAQYIANFNELEPYGLHELTEGIFDLDRAAFLIVDTWLSNAKIYEENDYNHLHKLIASIYNIFEHIILKNGHTYYHPDCFYDIEDFLRKRFYNYKNLYQEKGRVLDDLLLHEFGVELSKVGETNPFFKDMLQFVEEFKTFLQEIKNVKAGIDLKKYYRYIDVDLERIANLARLYDSKALSHYAMLFSFPYHYMVEGFDIERLTDQAKYTRELEAHPDVLHTTNKIGVYKSTPEEHIIFYDPETEEYTDFKDRKERTLDITPLSEYYIYHSKRSKKLEHESMLRNYFVHYFYRNYKEVLYNCELELSYTKDLEQRRVLLKLTDVLKHIAKQIPLEQYANEHGITMNQIYTILSFYTFDSCWHTYAQFNTFEAEELGNFFKEYEFLEESEVDTCLKCIHEVLAYSQTLNDIQNYNPEDTFKKLCIHTQNVIFIDQAILHSLDIDARIRKAIEEILEDKEKYCLKKEI